ncbi:MAG: hypothetical protein LBC74_08170, partial [Planctomycetaceae bacterium]|nr:hypothetical protein [Planctomycetaceae bacterium]
REKDDVIRRWIHWAKTDNPKTLYDPYYGYRRQAEWDDHGEAYPWSLDGPDIWYLLRIREPGTYKIGMYFFNKDGHNGNNRMRDYSVEIYPSLQNWKMEEWSRYKSSDWKIYSKYAESLVSKTSPLAKFRVRDFWGGVHKQFVVTGQGYYFVKIDRNYSFNTIVSSVSIDRLHGKPTYEERMNFGIPCLPATYYDPPPLPKKVYETTNGHKTALLWKLLDDKYAVKGGIEVQRKNRIAAYQAAIAYSNEEENVEQLAKAIKWYLNQWDEDQRQGWKAFMKRGHAKFLHRIPEQRDAIESYEKQKK